MAQSVGHLTLVQMILRFVVLSPSSASVLAAQTLEPASDSVSPCPSAPPPLARSLFLFLSKINIKKKIYKVGILSLGPRVSWEVFG